MRVFLSFATSDFELASRLKRSLSDTTATLDVFFAPDNLRAGGFWLPQLSEAIDRSDAFVILVGRSLGEWQKLEYYEAMRRHVSAPQQHPPKPYPIIPIIVSDSSPTLPFIKNVQWIKDLDPTSEETLALVRGALSGHDSLPAVDISAAINPYRGLLSMEEEDAALFFGRDAEIDDAIASIISKRQAITVLIGNSGVGKSSLVNAGIIPRLRDIEAKQRAGLSGSGWSYSVVRPGRRPFRALATAFARLWHYDPTDPARADRVLAWEVALSSTAGIPELIDATTDTFESRGLVSPSHFCIYIDQLEEIFSAEASVSTRFMDILSSSMPDTRVTLIATLRADYYGHFQAHPDAFQRSRRIDVRPLAASSLRSVLIEPAKALGVRLDDMSAVDRIVENIKGQPGALPLLVDYLTDIWREMQKAGSHILPVSRHTDVVHFGNALERRADQLLRDYSEVASEVRRVFIVSLVFLPQRGPPVRAKAYKDDLSAADWRFIELLAEPLWRLVVVGEEEDGRVYGELAHDILLMRWHTLHQWIESERSFLTWKSHTLFQMNTWRTVPTEQRDSALLLGISLAQSESWLRERVSDIPPELHAYIQTSLDARSAALRVEEEQRQMQKFAAIGQLAGGVAHDFNNVLTAIIGFTDLLLISNPKGGTNYPDLMSIRNSANRASGLTRQLLAYARRQTLRPQILRLGTHLIDLSVLLKRLIGDEIEIEIDVGESNWLVRADLVQIEQVVVNLVVNARDALASGGRIALSLADRSNVSFSGLFTLPAPTGDYVCLSVADDGTGIPPDILSHIFEPFFSTKELGKGTGLGLSTVQGIVRQSNGVIDVSSSVGVGTTFSVYIPRYVLMDGEAPYEEQAAGPSPVLHGTERILLVEDEPSVRSFAARALRSRGYTVEEAASGNEALGIFRNTKTRFDVVVTNIVMPDGDGPSLISSLRADQPSARVLAVSGYAEESVMRDIDSRFGVEFLPKPYSLDQLAVAVRRVLDRQN